MGTGCKVILTEGSPGDVIECELSGTPPTPDGSSQCTILIKGKESDILSIITPLTTTTEFQVKQQDTSDVGRPRSKSVTTDRSSMRKPSMVRSNSCPRLSLSQQIQTFEKSHVEPWLKKCIPEGSEEPDIRKMLSSLHDIVPADELKYTIQP